MTKEADIASHLQILTPLDWEPLFQLIPEIEQTTKFGTWIIEEGTFPYIEEIAVVAQFQEVAYQLGIVFSFDWMSWEEGSDALSNIETDYNQFDITTLCKFITAVVRNNRFNEGYLVSKFTDGTIVKLLRAFKQQVEAPITD